MGSLNIESSCSLNDGAKIPYIGLGVYASSTCLKACLSSFGEGYRQIDTAQLYGNEAEVGEAVRISSLPRSSIYVTSKVWTTSTPGKQATKPLWSPLKSCSWNTSTSISYNPRSGSTGRHQAWLGLQEALKEKEVKSIGVSNFTPKHVELLMESEGVTVKPGVNQIEYHPWNQQKDIVAYCRKESIAVQAYSPLTQGKKLSNPAIAKIAKKHGKTAVQVVQRWVLQQGVIAIPKSENPGRIKENATIYDFGLDHQDHAQIAKLDQGQERNVGIWNPFSHK